MVFTKNFTRCVKKLPEKWLGKIPHSLKDQLLVPDRKQLKSATFMGNITHVVEVFATEDRLCLAMEKVPDKSAEKTTLPTILKQVDVKEAIISDEL